MDKNPTWHAGIANKENGSNTVIADKAVVLVYTNENVDNITIADINWMSKRNNETKDVD